MIIAIDVDLTVVDTATAWRDWYAKKTGHTLQIKDVAYEMGNFMHKHKDPMAFWRDKNLYDNLEPIHGSVATLKHLYENGHNIVFVSHCFPDHIESKEYFLQRHFPFHSGFVDTEHKHLVRADVFIDDHEKYLKPIRETSTSTMLMQHKSPFNKDDKLFKQYDWNEIFIKLKEM
jgi:5'(3')-deoxyribonucleotidase